MVKASKLGPAAGLGLFLKGTTSAKAIVGSYGGKHLTAAQARASKSKYIVQFTNSQTGEQVFIDAATNKCKTRHINESFHHVNGVYDDNCKWEARNGEMYVVTDVMADNLPHDTEYYIRYGYPFWSSHTDLVLLQAVYDKYRIHMLDSDGYEYTCALQICVKLGMEETFKADRRAYKKKRKAASATTQAGEELQEVVHDTTKDSGTKKACSASVAQEKVFRKYNQ